MFQKDLKRLLLPIEKRPRPATEQYKGNMNTTIETSKVNAMELNELNELEFELNLDQGLEIHTEFDLQLDLNLILSGRIKAA